MAGSGNNFREPFECSLIAPWDEPQCSWSLLSCLECGGQGRNRTADASLFRADIREANALKTLGTACSKTTISGDLLEQHWNTSLKGVMINAGGIFLGLTTKSVTSENVRATSRILPEVGPSRERRVRRPRGAKWITSCRSQTR